MSETALRLNEGEEILLDELPSAYWTLGLYVGTFGLWAIWRKRHHFILTNQRVAITQGIVSKTERSVQISRIQDVNLQRSPMSVGYIRLSTAGGPLGIERIGPLTQEAARQFADKLSHILPRHGDGVGHDAEGVVSGSLAQQLRELAELRDSGVLSEEEFAAQKSKLLG